MTRGAAVGGALVLITLGCGRLHYDPAGRDADADVDPPRDASARDASAVDAAGDDAATIEAWTFVDEDQATFTRGDLRAGALPLSWSGAQVELAGPPPYDTTGAGVFVSAVFVTADPAAAWHTLAWVPEAPSARPLPDGGGMDPAGYAAGAVDARDIVLLLHLDGPDWSDGALVVDHSGQGHHGTLRFNGQGARGTPGAFGGALDLDRDAWVTLPGDFFDFGTGDFTYSIWVQMRDCSESNDNRVAMGGGDGNDRPHMWIGALCPERCAGGDGAFMNFLDESRSGPSLQACSGVVLTDGRWHHLAGVKRGHSPAVVALFVDGRQVASDTYDFGTNSLTYTGGEIRLGGFNLGGTQYDTSVVVDEAAIWQRALADGEIEALYRRGGARLELQVRACTGDGCAGEPFVGPDGTSASYFTEAALSGGPGSQADNLAPLGLVGATGQYRVRFSTGSDSLTPGLRRVALGARRP